MTTLQELMVIPEGFMQEVALIPLGEPQLQNSKDKCCSVIMHSKSVVRTAWDGGYKCYVTTMFKEADQWTASKEVKC